MTDSGQRTWDRERGVAIWTDRQRRQRRGSDTGNEKCVDHYMFSAFIIFYASASIVGHLREPRAVSAARAGAGAGQVLGLGLGV